jgi:Dyp-type peroxidase family
VAVAEPVLNVADIQGNILAGFNKDYQSFLLLRIGPLAADVTKARQWLRNTLAPQLAPTDQVLTFNRLFREAKAAGNPLPVATWINVAFSSAAIGRLLSPAVAAQFEDEAFTRGLAQRSEFLGDPTDPLALGNKRNWLYGGRPETEADIVVIVASDEPALRQTVVDSLLLTIASGGLALVVEPQHGATLPDPWRGHEHFGFKDGVSQPGVRGRASAAPDDFLTPRRIDASDRRFEYFGKPGQPLLWPGEFIFGQPRQPQFPLSVETDPGDIATVSPTWARDGSYLVIRRLRQDFGAFWGFVTRQALELGMTPDQFGALLVGRWRSGAPIMRSPSADNAALAADDLANNHFAFNHDTLPVPLVGAPADSFPQARTDFLGSVCPHFAHIRKVNPRDGATDLGAAEDTGSRALLRRGIPYGETLLGIAAPTPAQLAEDRGLIFASYQSSIVNQFEIIIRRWTNRPNLPTPGGHDAVIGQGHSHDGRRRRFIDLPGGRRCFIDSEWVIPTGGGYFFAPSISAVRNVLGA